MRLLNVEVSGRRAVALGVGALALVVIVAVGMVVAFTGDGGGVESPTPTVSFAVTTRPEATIPPTPPPPDTSYRLVFQEFGATEDKIWRVSPADPANREQLAAIQHREGWSVKPSLSPDSRFIAYVAVPEGAMDASYQGELFMLDLKRQETELIYRGVDQRFRPLWTPDSQLLYVRRLFGMETFVLQIKITRKLAPGETPVPTRSPTPTPIPTLLPEETPSPSPEGETPTPEGQTPTPAPTPDPVKVILQAHMGSVLTFIPVGIADDGKSMYLVQVQGGTGGGTLVISYAPATTQAIEEEEAKATPQPSPPPDVPPPTPTPTPNNAQLVVKLSEQIARDYDLSPDRKRLAFLAQELVEGAFVLRSYIADLGAKTVTAVAADGLPPGDHFRPLWHPDGSRLAVGLLPSTLETGAVALIPVAGGAPGFLPAPERGFDVPVAWSPDGTFLAVTSYSGDSLANLGSPRLDLVAPTGQRVIVADGVQFEAIGWFPQP